jgi:hypothetical protein
MTGTVTPYVYDDGGREAAGYQRKAGDCVARVIAIASGRPYAEIYQRLADGNDGVIHDIHDPSRDGTRCVYGYLPLEAGRTD